jgi:hypothetical protein
MKGRKTGARKPGSRNKITEEVRVALLKAFHFVGEADYLEEVARPHPAAG